MLRPNREAFLQQQMDVIWDQRPSQARGLGFRYDFSEPFKEVIPVRVIPKYLPLLNPPGDYVVQSPRRVNS